MSEIADLERARMLVDLDRAPQARALLERLLADDPGNPVALCLLAQACLGMKDYDAAARAATAAAREAPDDDWAHRLAALALAHGNRYGEARRYADAGVRIEPDEWRNHVARAQVDLRADAVSDVARGAAGEAVRLAPHESECHRTLGAVLLALNRTAAARAAFGEALRLDPQNAAARNDLARVDIKRRNLGRAAAGFADAAALDPADGVAAGNLVVVGARALRTVHLIMWLVLVISARFAVDAGGSQRAAAAAGLGVAAVALGAFAIALWRGARPRTLFLLRIVLRRDRYLAGWLGCLVAAFVLLAAAVIVPGSLVSGAETLSFLALLAGVVLSWLRTSRDRRRR